MAINMNIIEEWIAESNARNEEDLGNVVEEMKEVCVGLDNATLIYTKNVFCFGKKVEVLFFFQDHVVIGQEKEEYVEIEKLKYDDITNSNLKTNDKNTTLELKFANGKSIDLDSLNDNYGTKNWLFARQIKSIFKLI
ncbi:DUF3908 domain-containing protein [Bacillus cereus]|uniref:DUF3908 family protein n=1 Tax=Bacillus nitratireducens TaxID=2026193 RepID=A0ABU6P8F6_9BACI|nr:DUF3908 family protein [Bacillus nitratireducens]EEL88947.1 hypothetical protein bcere0029_11630 [Bacillus cereus AH1272]EEL94756.1 hypothetical protein bcere0030_11780 [Bacillus cereus AH1273]EJS52270.1 hypothetical protein ICG_04216 [Bacillus cereus BAG1X1-3]EOO79478.1 hypothetical protein IC7_00549 [Bacillus cereus BAG1O-1]EOP57829.1 hypothetical protein IKQ_00779 [Bacillus cereus VDM053]OSY01333.1 hypothetical protein BTJ45_00395 [Bacillus mycoides]PDY22769.1 DUF3908 domain-containing